MVYVLLEFMVENAIRPAAEICFEFGLSEDSNECDEQKERRKNECEQKSSRQSWFKGMNEEEKAKIKSGGGGKRDINLLRCWAD